MYKLLIEAPTQRNEVALGKPTQGAWGEGGRPEKYAAETSIHSSDIPERDSAAIQKVVQDHT
jgi:hypothetical protein